MRTEFADEPPSIELRNGLAFLTYVGESRPYVAVPIHVLRRFCETGIRRLNAYDAEQAGKVVPIARCTTRRDQSNPHG
jgi:hypothetical protein